MHRAQPEKGTTGIVILRRRFARSPQFPVRYLLHCAKHLLGGAIRHPGAPLTTEPARLSRDRFSQ